MQNRDRNFGLLSQAMAYLIGGIFLYTSSSVSGMTEISSLIAKIIGGSFMAFAFFLMVVSFIDAWIKWAERLDIWLFFGLFVTTMASLIKASVETKEIFFIVVAIIFFLLLIAAFLYQVFRQVVGTPEKDKKILWSRMLRALALVLSLFALSMVLMQLSVMGGPMLYLALSVTFLCTATWIS